MAESDFHQIEKLIPYKAKPKSHASIQDGDQIHTPNVRDASHLDSTASFKAIYANYLNETSQVQGDTTAQGEDLKLAMEEAKHAFNSMMEIREQLNQAYKEFMQMS